MPVSGPSGAPAVLEREEGRGWCHETWQLTGSRGDSVLAEAWLAEHPGPVVVIGHGAEADRRAPHPAATGRGWARHGISVVAADAPGHGDRAGAGGRWIGPEGREGGGRASSGEFGDPPAGSDYLAWWVDDQRRVVDAVEARFGRVPIGYLGVSMGAVFGVFLLVAESRIRAAVLAVGGFFDPGDGPDPGAADAVGVAGRLGDVPVLMVQADGDEVFSRDAAFALYEALGSDRKEISFLPGTHTQWCRPARWNRRMLRFFAETLGLQRSGASGPGADGDCRS
jgi:alpha-beta hydrolase superfamily lysophospholipase